MGRNPTGLARVHDRPRAALAARGELETPLVNDARRDAAEAEAADADGGGEGDEKKEDTVPAWARMLNKANSTREGMALLAEKVRTRRCRRRSHATLSVHAPHSRSQAPHVYYMNGSRIKSMLAETDRESECV